MDVSLRLATATDALCIGVLGTQVYLDTYATDGIRPSLAREVLAELSVGAVERAFAEPAARFVVAERAGHLVGFAHVMLDEAHALVTSSRAAKLHRLYVQERFTGRGLGTTLLRRAESVARGDGARALWLTSWIGNRRALAFYPRCGYRDIGRTDHVFENESHENRVFVRDFGGA